MERQMIHRYNRVVRLHDTDAAGRLYFARQFEFAHEAYEEWMRALGWPFERLLRQSPFFVVIVHAEADYRCPLFVGDHLIVEVAVESVGNTSFVLGYTISRDGQTVGSGRTVHVCIDKQSGQKYPLPDEFKKRLTAPANDADLS